MLGSRVVSRMGLSLAYFEEAEEYEEELRDTGGNISVTLHTLATDLLTDFQTEFPVEGHHFRNFCRPRN